MSFSSDAQKASVTLAAALAGNPRAFEWATRNDYGVRPSPEVQAGWIASNIAELAKLIVKELES